jgi:hypothetical protein
MLIQARRGAEGLRFAAARFIRVKRHKKPFDIYIGTTYSHMDKKSWSLDSSLTA